MGQYPHRRRPQMQNRRPQIAARRPKMRIMPIRAAAVLFCLTLLSTYFVTGLFARYAVSAQLNEQARVAAFSIKGGETLTKAFTAGINPEGSTDVKLIIHNNSEVAVEYTIKAEKRTQNLPLEFYVAKKEGGTPSEWRTDSVTVTDQQSPGSHDDEYDLKIKWEPKGDSDLDLIGMVDYFAVTVTAVQID